MDVRIRWRVFPGGSHVFCVVSLPVQLLYSLFQCAEEFFEVGDVRDRAFFHVLKQLDLAQDIPGELLNGVAVTSTTLLPLQI